MAFCVASATDFVDGWIARKWELVTSFGKVADPIADKALTGTALVLLSAYDQVPWWVTVADPGPRVGCHGAALLGDPVRHHPGVPRRQAQDGLQTLAITWYLWPFRTPFDAGGPWLMGAALLVDRGDRRRLRAPGACRDSAPHCPA